MFACNHQWPGALPGNRQKTSKTGSTCQTQGSYSFHQKTMNFCL